MVRLLLTHYHSLGSIPRQRTDRFGVAQDSALPVLVPSLEKLGRVIRKCFQCKIYIYISVNYRLFLDLP